MEDDIGCIYKVTNLVNGKSYIGQHNKPHPEERWKQHIYSAKNNSDLVFHRALRKYGADKFNWERIYMGCIDSLNEKEYEYAEQYNTYMWDNPGGYNMMLCGNRGLPALTSRQLSIVRRASLEFDIL